VYFGNQFLVYYECGEYVICTRLRITPSDKRLPLNIVRKQYLISVSFAMTINKSQGQSLSKVGVSRVKSKQGLKVIVCDRDRNVSKTTTNVVYREVLEGL
jgi:hypothetical protein